MRRERLCYCRDYWNLTSATLNLEGTYNKSIAYPATTDVTAKFGSEFLVLVIAHVTSNSFHVVTPGLSLPVLLLMHLVHHAVLLGPATIRSYKYHNGLC